jgi:Met-zincin/Domain of unknown function (DUF5117)
MRAALRKATLVSSLALAFVTAGWSHADDSPPPPPQNGTPPVVAAPQPAPLAGAPAGPPAAAQPKPFNEVIKGAKEIPGYLKVFEKDEKVWIAIKPDQLDKPFFFSYNIPRSIGERGLYGSQMGDSGMAVFHKIGANVQLIARNTHYFAKEGTPQAHFVRESFSDSLIASAPVVSQPHADDKAILIEASALLYGDIPGYLTNLETAFRIPYALDAKNTNVESVSNADNNTGIEVQAHFAVPKLSAPPLTPPPVPLPPPPTSTPDPRSFFVSFYYNFSPLPEQVMRPRIADERVGYFTTARVDYTDDITPRPRVNYVHRWRLEKKDPAAAVSEPKEPIVYWLDKNIPEKYRQSVTDGILEWNKAFEKAGFRNAIVVKQQADKDTFDTMDARHASIRWFTGADIGFAIGPSHVDPRSGEILDADIGMSDVFARGARRLVAEDLGRSLAFDMSEAYAGDPMRARKGFLACDYGAAAEQETEFAFDLLEARGLDMDGPEASELAKDYVKDVIMHEVGHTLGLRHNFVASKVYTLKQISDKSFSQANGLTASVMDYNPFNIALTGQAQGEYVMSSLGPYDYWAIEYAYREMDAATEAADLARIASRSTEPQLAFATDEDAGAGKLFIGIDPDVNRFDLGADPLEYYKRRVKLSRELWDRLQNMKLQPGESYERLTRSFVSGFQQLARVAPLAVKYVGGVTTHRDRAGSGRALFEPMPAARQREALTLISNDFFQVDSFRFRPEFLGHLALDQFDRPANPDLSLSATVLTVQKVMLGEMMSDPVAMRLLGAPEKAPDASKLLRLSDLYDTLQASIWSELKSGRDITMIRRNLQREDLRIMTAMLLHPAPTTPADARSLMRMNAQELVAELKAAQGKGGYSKEAKAHIAEALDTLQEALKAPMQRAG